MYCHSHRQSKTIKRLWAKFNQTGRARDIQQRSRSKPKVQIKATFKKVRGKIMFLSCIYSKSFILGEHLF